MEELQEELGHAEEYGDSSPEEACLVGEQGNAVADRPKVGSERTNHIA